MMNRITIIKTLKVCEDRIRELRQQLEAEERGEVQGGLEAPSCYTKKEA